MTNKGERDKQKRGTDFLDGDNTLQFSREHSFRALELMNQKKKIQ